MERAPNADRFQLAILRGDWHDLGLGYDNDRAFPKLVAARTDALFVVEVNHIEAYHWGDQSITLTPEATCDLIAALEAPESLKESVRALNAMRAKLGWGDCIDHALYTKGFLALLNGEPLYGGIFLDATSQRAIRYPVIRAALIDGKARFTLMPVHVAFYMKDPLACAEEEGDAAIAREMSGDWRQFPAPVKNMIARWAASDNADALRQLIRSPAVRAIMEAAGKLR